MNGADYVLKCLRAEGVDTVFGYPGGAVIPLFDALYRDGGFNVYRPSHEQGGTHAADGYARASGEVGVMIATSGPGATNTVTGIATAFSDSVPLVVISGQVGSSLLGKNSFQEIDIVSITMPITKYNILVTDPKDIGPAIRRAFYTARSGRPGPVLVDITKDTFEAPAEDIPYAVQPTEIDTRYLDCMDEIKKACDLIRGAERPVIYAGGGVLKSRSSEELRKFAKLLNIPVTNSIMGMGVFDRTDPLSYGIVGMHGQRETNLMVYRSDVVIGIGVRFSDRAIGNRTGFSEKAKVIHIDIDETEFNKNIDVDVRILGDFKKILQIMTEELTDVHFDRHISRVEEKQSELDFLPRRYIEVFQDKLPENTNVATDVGQHQMWTMMYWKAKKPYSVITSGGQGTMGFGVGAAMGAKIARPEEEMLLITGDGSFRMNHHEVLAAATHKVPMTIAVFNNHTLGMVRQWQGLFQDKRYSQTDIYDALDLEALAKAYGVNYGGKVHSPEELEKVLEEINLDEVNIIECMIDHDDGAYPMVAAGSSINNIIDRDQIY